MKFEKERSLYKLELGESLMIEPYLEFVRVPGGWITKLWSDEKQESISCCFVPYDNEFQYKYIDIDE